MGLLKKLFPPKAQPVPQLPTPRWEMGEPERDSGWSPPTTTGDGDWNATYMTGRNSNWSR